MRLGLAALAMLLSAPASAQYWSYPPGYYYPQGHVRPAPRPRHHQRSAAEWRESIKAQGRAFCRAHPRDPICPH
jgi:hypothetical protein